MPLGITSRFAPVPFRNPWQGSFIIDKLTETVEEAVYKEFEAISERGGALGAMDTMYQRGKIQEESMYYSVFDQGRKKHDGSLPLIGVNTFLPKDDRRHRHHDRTDPLDRGRTRPADPQRRNVPREPQWVCAGKFEAAAAGGARSAECVCAVDGAVKYNSEGQISHALYDVGGEYRRNM